MRDPAAITFLFTDIEGSTRLWDERPDEMRPALARHDALVRKAIEGRHGTVVKMTGDGVYAAFDEAGDAVEAVLALQLSLADPAATEGVTLRVRCGLHAGAVESRDRDFFGGAVNRAARIMSVAHGGQVLLSQAVADQVADRLPPPMSLCDLGTVRLRDLARPERVYQLVHPLLRREFPALRSLEATPNNLPQQVSSFIGRERELAEVRALLASTRLLTLVGAGGLGKTRLSLQVGADVLDDFPDGVWFVEFAPLADPRLVPQAVASALGVKEEAGRPVIEALVKHVGDRQLLLILDNCEHLVRSCADLARTLLQAGARVKVLSSSREALHVPGEISYPVPTLTVPDPSQAPSVEALTQSEAVRLFGDRAAAVQSGFRLADRNAATVAGICRRLDGIPLAIELAAARVQALPVETIAERLSDRFRLLTRGDPSALPRQQTLRACIDWSYDLLAESERALLRRLAVFAGGFTLAAAEAVAAGGEIAPQDVIDLLTLLAAKSLVEFDPEGARYRMLETVRQYAWERLGASGEGEGFRSRHLSFYVAFAEEARLELQGPDQARWLAQLDLERENLLAAHAWCDRAATGAELGLRLVASVISYWVTRGLLALGRQLTVEALAREGAAGHDVPRIVALNAAGTLGYFMGDYAAARRYLDECLALARQIGDKRRAGSALRMLGAVAIAQRDQATARAYLSDALALMREVGEARHVAAALSTLAESVRAEGDVDAAERLYREALAIYRTRGDRENIGVVCLNLAGLSIGRGSVVHASEMLLETHAIARELGSRRLGLGVLDCTVGVAALLEAWERAARMYFASEAQLALTGLHRDHVDEESLAALIVKARATLGDPAFAGLEAAGRALRYEDALAEAREWLAELAGSPGGPGDAVA